MIQRFKTSAAAEAADTLDWNVAMQRMVLPKPQVSAATMFNKQSGPYFAEEKTETTKAEIPAAAEVTLTTVSATAETGRERAQ